MSKISSLSFLAQKSSTNDFLIVEMPSTVIIIQFAPFVNSLFAFLNKFVSLHDFLSLILCNMDTALKRQLTAGASVGSRGANGDKNHR
jgi:hypothetical protein